MFWGSNEYSDDSDDSVRWKEELARATPPPEVEYWKYGPSSDEDSDDGKKSTKSHENHAAKDLKQAASDDKMPGLTSDEEDAAHKRVGDWVQNAESKGEAGVDVCSGRSDGATWETYPAS